MVLEYKGGKDAVSKFYHKFFLTFAHAKIGVEEKRENNKLLVLNDQKYNLGYWSI